MRIFLDACVIIYWVEAAEPFYSELIMQFDQLIKQYPDHVLTISRLSFLECLIKPMREKDKKTMKEYHDFFELPELEIVEIDAAVVNIATRLRVEAGLRTPDAIQAASCLSLESPHLFLTNDKHFASVANLNTITL